MLYLSIKADTKINRFGARRIFGICNYSRNAVINRNFFTLHKGKQLLDFVIAFLLEMWENTAAYREYSEKKYSAEKQNELSGGMNALIAEFAVCRADVL